MNLYPKEKLTIKELLKATFQYYPKTLLPSILFVIFASLAQNIYLMVLPFIPYPWIYAIVGMVVSLYFAAAVVYTAHLALLGEKSTLRQRAAYAFHRWPRLILYGMVYVLCFAVMFAWLHLLVYLGKHWDFIGQAQPLWDLLLVGLPLMLANLLLLMAFPILVIKKDPFFSCLKESAALAWKCRFKAIFVAYLIMWLFVYITVPTTVHADWLIHYHLKILVDIVAYLIFMPLITNYLLLLLNDLELR